MLGHAGLHRTLAHGPPPPGHSGNPGSSARPNNMRAWLLIILAVAVSGCAGYKLGPTNGVSAGSRTVQIQAFHQPHPGTAHHRISQHFPAQTIAAGRHLPPAKPPAAPTSSFRARSPDLIATGFPIDPNDVLTPQEYTLTMQAHIVAVDVNTGKTFINRTVQG